MANPITLEALRILDAIDRKKSFAAAAEELFRVPSAVSYTIKKLEEDLGVVIFDRSKRKAEFTATGKLLLTHGRSILQATDNLSDMVIQAESGWEPEVRICVDNIMNYELIYELIDEFQSLHPAVDIKLVEETFGGTLDALVSDRADIAIGVPEDIDTLKYQVMSLGKVNFVFAIACDHPLTSFEQPVPVEEIKKYPSIVVSDSSKNMPPRSTGIFEGQRRLTVPSVDKKIVAHQKGLGVGYLPEFRIREELASGQLLEMQTLPATQRRHTIAIAWQKSKNGNALKWFVNRLDESDRSRLIS